MPFGHYYTNFLVLMQRSSLHFLQIFTKALQQLPDFLRCDSSLPCKTVSQSLFSDERILQSNTISLLMIQTTQQIVSDSQRQRIIGDIQFW